MLAVYHSISPQKEQQMLESVASGDFNYAKRQFNFD